MSLLDANIKSQLQSLFTKLRRPIILKAALDGSKDAANIESLLKDMATLSELICYEVDTAQDVRRPSFTISFQDGRDSIRFAALPMGHEFTSFILALLQSGGHPPKISDDKYRCITDLKEPLNFEVFISLSCYNCPDVVQAINVMAVLNPNVTVTVIDGALFREEASKRGVTAVPTLFLNGKNFLAGRHDLSEILEKLVTRTSGSSKLP